MFLGKRKKNTDALETYSVYDDIEGTSTTPNSYTMEENKYEEQINLENLILSSFSDAPASTTTGNRSLKLHDFVLNSPIDTVIDRCVIRQSLWFSVLEATGRDMLTVSGWNSINSYINQSIIENLTISSNHSNYVDVDLLKYIWYRQSTYSQEYRGSFSSPTTAVHTLHELINTAQLWNIANTSNNTITKLPTGSVIIIHQIDLSNFTQFNNCSYTLRWVLEPIHQLDSDITIHNLKNQTNNSLPLGKATKIKVTVDLQVPTTSVIVKDLRQLIVLWHNSAEKLLQDKNYHQIWADRQRELSQSEVLILNSMNNSITEATTVINTPKEADHTVLGAIRSLFGFDTNSYKDTVTIVKSDVSNINDNSSVNSNSIISESGNSQDSSIDSVDNKDSYSNSYANQSNIESTFTVSHDSVNHADSHTLLVESSLLNELENNFQQLRNQWRSSALIVKDISIIPSKFKETLVLLGLKKKGRRGIFKYVRVRVFIRFCFWFGLMRGLFEGAKRSDDIAWGAETVLKNMRDFVDRRLATPTRT